MDNECIIRLITDNDISAVLEIYAPYVRNTIVSFEYEVPSLQELTERVKTITAEYPWLVCVKNGVVIGYAYAGKYRYRTAYQWSPESTIYLSPDFHGKGIGHVLYSTLFAILRLQGYFNVFAAVGLPNDRSVQFHLAAGFEEIGTFKKVGYKLGNWHDTKWFQLQLAEHIRHPVVPKTIGEIGNSLALNAILNSEG
jgi:L-amino acid N-acyltransferase YncA